jgi:hypothetical protein
MGKPPWDGLLEAKVQKFCDARRDSIKFAIKASAINLDDPMLDHLGRKLLEGGPAFDRRDSFCGFHIKPQIRVAWPVFSGGEVVVFLAAVGPLCHRHQEGAL